MSLPKILPEPQARDLRCQRIPHRAQRRDHHHPALRDRGAGRGEFSFRMGFVFLRGDDSVDDSGNDHWRWRIDYRDDCCFGGDFRWEKRKRCFLPAADVNRFADAGSNRIHGDNDWALRQTSYQQERSAIQVFILDAADDVAHDFAQIHVSSTVGAVYDRAFGTLGEGCAVIDPPAASVLRNLIHNADDSRIYGCVFASRRHSRRTARHHQYVFADAGIHGIHGNDVTFFVLPSGSMGRQIRSFFPSSRGSFRVATTVPMMRARIMSGISPAYLALFPIGRMSSRFECGLGIT